MKLLNLWFVIAGVGGLSMAALPVFSDEAAGLEALSTLDPVSSSPAVLREAWKKAEAAGQLADSRRYCEQYVQALQSHADQGDAEAMVELGKLMYRGTPSYPRNLEQARAWFEKAAQAGQADSQYQLAFMYRNGLGGNKDEALSAKWYAESRKNMEARAAGGDGEAAFWVGIMHFKGEGTPEDKKLALQWMEKSAKLGFKMAAVLLARMYREGLGTERNEGEAFRWFLKAAEQGQGDAMMETALAYKNAIGVERDLAQARHWFSKAANLKNPYALRELAGMMRAGEGGEKDIPQARAYYIQAASYGEPLSAVEASRMLANDENASDDDVKKAREILFAAADRFRSPLGQYELGLFDWKHGDKESGVYWICTAAMGGYAPAMARMGTLSLIPFSGVTWNPVAAWQWWDAAAQGGNAPARFRANWLLWGGGGFLLIAVGTFLIWMNRWINRKWAVEEK